MPTIDLPAIQTYYEEQLRLARMALGGGENHKRFIGLTEGEHDSIVALEEILKKYEDALSRLVLACTDLVVMGEPVMPTLAVSDTTLTSLDREAAENAAFKAQFVAITEPVAFALGKPVFGEPEPQ